MNAFFSFRRSSDTFNRFEREKSALSGGLFLHLFLRLALSSSRITGEARVSSSRFEAPRTQQERERGKEKERSRFSVSHRQQRKAKLSLSPPPPSPEDASSMGQGQSGGAGFPGQAPGAEKKKEVRW